jgi:hypothetical protein
MYKTLGITIAILFFCFNVFAYEKTQETDYMLKSMTGAWVDQSTNMTILINLIGDTGYLKIGDLKKMPLEVDQAVPSMKSIRIKVLREDGVLLTWMLKLEIFKNQITGMNLIFQDWSSTMLKYQGPIQG